ncbi:hypothetical protein [Halovivax sp.]|uniref:DUF7344 domain-containing protein n=1 Tax=Halovivax sp. TaxID=1935978 RepID=UPI0025BF6148|nr:hypothetical protein [Halovivax sp.]
MDGGFADLDVETVCSLLGDARRRRLLRRLHDTSEPRATTALARSLAEERDAPVDRIRTQLVHVDLPLLADAGVVRYESKTGVIEPTDRVELLVSCAETIERAVKSTA